MNPNIFLNSTIQIPAFGRSDIELEKVPIISKGKQKPIPKEKRRRKPKNLFPRVATIVKSKAKPGERQGEITVPLITPATKAEMKVPPFLVCAEFFKKFGVYIS